MGSISAYSISGNRSSPQLVLDVNDISYSVLDNTSVVGWVFKIVRPYQLNSSAKKNYTVVVNGQTYSGSVTVGGIGTKTLASGQMTIAHNSDGKKTIACSFTMKLDITWSGTYVNNVSASGNIALTNIPRYATSNQTLISKTETSMVIKWTSDSVIDYIWYSVDNGTNWTGIDVADGTSGQYTIENLTANTEYNVKTRVRRKEGGLTTDSDALTVTTYAYPYANSTPNFVIGDQLTIGIYNPLNRSLIIDLLGADNSECSTDLTSGDSITGFDDATTTEALYESIPNAASGTYKVKVTSDVSITTTTGGTYTVNPANCAPTIANVAYADTNASVIAVTDDNQQIVRNQSIVQYSASGFSAQFNATIAACSVTVNGNTYQLALNGGSASGGNAVIDSASDVEAVFTVTDSRGVTGSKAITVDMLDWVLPSAIITLQRKDNFYTETHITVDANYSSIDGKNTISISYKAKKEEESTYTITGTLQDNVEATFNADNSYRWDVVVTLVDIFNGTTVYNLHLSRGTPIIYFDRLKSSVGVNCFPQGNESFEVNGKTIIDMVYPVGSIYISTGNTSPATLFGGTWSQIQDCFLLASGQTYTAGDTGGEAAHTLTAQEMPEHQHALQKADASGSSAAWTVDGVDGTSNQGESTSITTSEVGGGQAHNNLPPYLVVNVWVRTQ